MRFSRRILTRLVLILLGVGIALVIAELVCRRMFPEPSGFQVWPAGLRHAFKAAPDVMPGVEGESRFSVNSWGIRGDEFNDSQTERILALGGSATECLFLDDTEAWPQLVQKNLVKQGRAGAWVGNVGKSGMTTRDHVLQMQLLVPALPKIQTVILMAGANDFMLRLSDASYNPRHLDNPVLAREQMKHAFAAIPGPPAGGLALSRAWAHLAGPRATGPVQDDPRRFYGDFRRRRREAKERLVELPDLMSSVDEYARNLGRIASLARSQSVRLVLVTQPTMWKERMTEQEEALLWFGGADNFLEDSATRYYTPSALAQGMRLYNGRMRGLAKEQGIECIDLADILPKDTTVFYDDLHFNENGASVAAQIISEYLRARPPAPRAAR